MKYESGIGYDIIVHDSITIRGYKPHRSNLECFEKFAPVIAAFAQKHGVEVVDLYNPHGKPMDVLAPSKGLAIVFWSLPMSLHNYCSSCTLSDYLGFPLEGGVADTIQPEGGDLEFAEMCQLIWNPRGTELLAAVTPGRVIYITNDLIHSHEGLEPFARLLDLIEFSAAEVTGAVVLEDDFEKEAEQMLEKLIASAYRELMPRMFSKYEEAKRELHKALQRQTEFVGSLSATCTAIKKGDYSAEIEKILEEPFVERVVVRKGEIDVYTHPIFIRSPIRPEIFYLGRYRIELTTTSLRKVVNLDVRRLTDQSELHHAHIFSRGGNPCFGNISDVLDKCLELGNLSDGVKLIIQFLRTFPNHNSTYYSNLTSFPRIPLEQFSHTFPDIDPETLLPIGGRDASHDA